MRIKTISQKKVNGIVIFGPMGSGKDALADMLKVLEEKVQKYNLSALVRSVEPYIWVEPMWIGNERTFYQKYVDKLREIDVDILNKYTLGVIYKKLNIRPRTKDTGEFDKLLIANLSLIREIELPIIVGGRTIADVKFWESKGFLKVGIEIEEKIRFERLILRDGVETAKNSSSSHNTEKDLPYIIENLCDVIIDNNGSFNDLKAEASDLLKIL